MQRLNFKQGDIIRMDFNPIKGHEQRGNRPALIVSNDEYNKLMGLSVICPITNNTKAFPTHVCLDDRTKTTGAILCEHLRSFDLKARNAEFVEKLPKNTLEEVSDIIESCF